MSNVIMMYAYLSPEIFNIIGNIAVKSNMCLRFAVLYSIKIIFV